MKVFISGVNGGTGSIMARFLLEKGIGVVGGVRGSSFGEQNVLDLKKYPFFTTCHFDLTDESSIQHAIKTHKPDWFINLAAITSVVDSNSSPRKYLETNSNSLIYIFEALIQYAPNCRVFQAGSSQIFGRPMQGDMQDENHPRNPATIYGLSKSMAEQICEYYRGKLQIIYGILYNHSGPNSNSRFVLSKIAKGIPLAIKKKYNPVKLGNIDARRDFTHAEDICRGIYLALSNRQASDCYVFASGTSHSVKEVLDFYIDYFKIDGNWYENGFRNGHILVEMDRNLYRPEPFVFVGDATRARKELGWELQKSWQDLLLDLI